MVMVGRKGQKQSPDSGARREIAMKVCMYAIYFLMIYALLVGFKMSEILSAGKEIGDLLKATHVHVLTDSFLLLLVIYDVRLKRAENLKVYKAEELVGIGVLGLVLIAAGFSIAALIPAMVTKGLYIMHIGQPLFFFSFFGYVVSAIIAEVYK